MTSQHADIRQYVTVLLKRKRVILLTMCAVFLGSAALAFFLPPAYRSTATILIEEQEVPPDLVRAAITSYADQRIQTIKHQVMTRAHLWKIVEQYGLYESLRRRSTTEEVLKQLVDDIHLDVISADVVDRRTHQPIKATIAFTLAYDGETPPVAQKVASELTSLFLAENLKSRERHAQETTAFLKQEAERLAGHIEALETKIADFKQRADRALPELMQLNMQLMNQTDRELMDADQKINALEERKSYLEGQLATLKPNTPIITASGERILDPGERLKALRAQYVSSAAYLSPDHPDIIKMKSEIDALRKETGEPVDRHELEKRLTDEKAKLAAYAQRYGPSHPDVVKTKAVVASLEKEIAQAPAPSPAKPVKPENPAYINIQAQLTSTKAELSALRATRADLRKKAQRYALRLERTPEIEPEYQELTRDRDSSAQKYQEIRSRLLEASVSEGLEVQRKGERFSLIDPPDLPEKPEKPNRPVILFLGLLLAVMGGVGSGAAAENLDRSIGSSAALQALLKAPPLGVVPYLHNAEDRARIRRHVRAVRVAVGSCVVLLVMVVHLLWMPLDVLWFLVMRKLGL
jgi:uncharacterized protein involved in exopolysaccharide biosynthesis